MLGYDVSERSVSRSMRKRPADPEAQQRWHNFLHNHRDVFAAMDLFTVPTATFRVLYVFFVIHHARRSVLRVRVTEHPTAGWITQQLPEAFPDDRTHLGLGKGTPSMRTAVAKPFGSTEVVALPRIGGLHHRYEWRKAALKAARAITATGRERDSCAHALGRDAKSPANVRARRNSELAPATTVASARHRTASASSFRDAD